VGSQEVTHAITLHAWWAWAVVRLGKRRENRSHLLPKKWINRPLALHSGKNPGDAGKVAACYAKAIKAEPMVAFRDITQASIADQLHRGAVVAVITFTDSIAPGADDGAPWSIEGFHQWVIGSVRRVEPIPCRGALGFFPLPQVVREALASQREEVGHG